MRMTRRGRDLGMELNGVPRAGSRVVGQRGANADVQRVLAGAGGIRVWDWQCGVGPLPPKETGRPPFLMTLQRDGALLSAKLRLCQARLRGAGVCSCFAGTPLERGAGAGVGGGHALPAPASTNPRALRVKAVPASLTAAHPSDACPDAHSVPWDAGAAHIRGRPTGECSVGQRGAVPPLSREQMPHGYLESPRPGAAPTGGGSARVPSAHRLPETATCGLLCACAIMSTQGTTGWLSRVGV